ncbi:DUF4259 domain-containing protein [Kitasatospora sp. NBC_01287]|uniref:DUF4259 domain-containing protein n=1 Tax=Kitasatospora sp. NBC_01287 TaxID=2903573 RepID=UPI00224E61DF|nr:DUF4259 domain-containing protein [Kitasatospora sp. NBC_01287]MCX4750860.1 DUF4259 domain-containing protein [Kitasatospora sp. NBC_01287]
MGTWDAGPFDNDTAADFSLRLDEAGSAERPALLLAALERALAADVRLEPAHAEEAMAAVALVAAQLPGGEPIDPAYAPKERIPWLDAEFGGLARRVLDLVGGEGSALAEQWADSGEEPRWRERLARLRAVLDGHGRWRPGCG